MPLPARELLHEKSGKKIVQAGYILIYETIRRSNKRRHTYKIRDNSFSSRIKAVQGFGVNEYTISFR